MSELLLNEFIEKAQLPYRRAEVLVVAAEEPARYWLWLEEYGFNYTPDLIIIGITLGNDISQSYLAMDPQGGFEIVADQARTVIRTRTAGIGFFTPPFSDTFLPELARRYPSWWSLQFHVLSNRLSNTHIGQRISSFWGMSKGIGSIYGDSWYGEYSVRPIHVFDPSHGLGLFYTPMLPIVEESFNRFFKSCEECTPVRVTGRFLL